ncbi:MAG: aldehyde ferredoxin oxidoreductase family protein [Desulfobacterales bacterium]|nr:aldehyde ferredoxin oxidoreductase family protein [Desulfobacterales bacterium]
MNLYKGKVLIVNLTDRSVKTEPLREEWKKDYWGCWGMALRYFYDEVSPDVDPMSPENAIVIMTGPLSGTNAPLTSRFCMVSKSPKTGTVFESNGGGSFGPELKYAGYDGIIIRGKADGLVYLKIDDDKVSIEDAAPMAGKGIFDTEVMLRDAVGCQEAKSLSIGPAGENGVPFACVGSEAYRQLGRGGTGALFGSKNLKSIVCRGSGSVRVADMSKYLELVNKYKETDVKTEDNLWAKTDGTPLLMDVTNDLGIHPTKNFTYGFDDNVAGLNSEAMQAAKIGDRACSSCVFACGKYTHINGAEMEGPEYETLVLGGSNLEINDLETVIRFNRICDDLGMDTISCGNVIGMAMDMTEKGRKDFNLKFGDKEAFLKVISEIAEQSTERGKDLAMGGRGLAEKYNSADLSTEVKNLEFPAYDPRGSYGMGIAYATSERGACHMRAFPAFDEDVFDLDGEAESVVNGQNFASIKFSMCVCDFWGTVTTDIMADLMSAGLGEEVTAAELNKSGERIWNLNKLFNMKAGFTAKDDYIPEKVMNQPLEKGIHAGKVMSTEAFEKAKIKYYELRGWDENGIPSQDKLAELGLSQL